MHQINAPRFNTDLGLQKQCWIFLQMVKFKDFSRPANSLSGRVITATCSKITALSRETWFLEFVE